MPLRKISRLTSSLKNYHFLMIDFCIFIFAPFLAFMLRFDGGFYLKEYINELVVFFVVFTALKLIIFYVMGIYKRFWNMASVDELAQLFFVGIVLIIAQILLLRVLRIAFPLNFVIVPYSITLLDSILTMLLVASARFSIRLFKRANERITLNSEGDRVLIIGAGEAGMQVASEIQKNQRLKLSPVGFVDDDKSKHQMKIRNVKVLGDSNDIPNLVRDLHVKKVIIAMPTASGAGIRKIISICQELGVEIQTLPGISDIIGGKVSIDRLRKIRIEDLLRREPIHTNNQNVFSLIKDKTVLVTGAGGSIGSELCRQILTSKPSRLLLLGHGENSIFNIEQELMFRISKSQIYESSKTELISIIADIRNPENLEKYFGIYKPDIVFHAAAHKHVPLMEENPIEAIRNNIFGTKNLIELSIRYNIEKFILISTDKAVNPTSVMGASKRVAEMILLDAYKKHKKQFSAVRFGNVLGSNGSVIKTFQRQLKHGGPITITHPNITRYFMTIPEAVQLVLQAFSIGRGGEIFVLDMGDPVKVVDLAKDMIKLAGLQEGDIELHFTGLRPGEKLYEELFNDGEVYTNTVHPKILIAKNASEFIYDNLENWICQFNNKPYSLTKSEIHKKFKEIIPEFQNYLGKN